MRSVSYNQTDYSQGALPKLDATRSVGELADTSNIVNGIDSQYGPRDVSIDQEGQGLRLPVNLMAEMLGSTC